MLVALALLSLAGLPASTAADGPSPAVVFDDQRTSGRIVIVDGIQLPDPGFVVVHDPPNSSDEDLGKVRGSSVHLGPGQHHNVPVTLERNLTERQTLIAVLYNDTNDNHVFDARHVDGHRHSHDAKDEPYTHGDVLIGDKARVGPHPEARESSSVDPLLVGAGLAVASVTLWAVRFR